MTQVHPRINIGLQYIRNTSEIHFEVTYTSRANSKRKRGFTVMMNKAREQHQDIATVVKLLGTHLNTYKHNALMNMSPLVLDKVFISNIAKQQ